MKERGCRQDEKDFGCDECELVERLLESLVKHIKSTQVRGRYKDSKEIIELVERMESHMNEKHVELRCEECRPEKEKTEIKRENKERQETEQNSPQDTIEERKKWEKKEKTMKERKRTKAKLKADVRMDVKLRKREEQDRKEKEEEMRRREKQEKVRKDKEIGKGDIMKRKEEKQKQIDESFKEREIQEGEKKMENKMKRGIRLEETIENKIEKELGRMKDRKEKEKERQKGLENEKIDKGKIEKARSVLVMAIVLEQMLGLLMQDRQDEADNEKYGVWPEEIREDIDWDIEGELNKDMFS